jgi:hypothetical protein
MFVDDERLLANALLSRRTGGAARTLFLSDIYGSRERLDLYVRDLHANAGPNGDDEYFLGAAADAGRIVAGLAVDLAWRPEDGARNPPGPEIARAWREDSDERGSIFYVTRFGASVLFIFRRNVADVPAAACAGARRIVERFLERHRLGPREFRPGRFSEGWIVSETSLDWHPCPAAKSPDGERWLTEILSTEKLYLPLELAAAATEELSDAV